MRRLLFAIALCAACTPVVMLAPPHMADGQRVRYVVEDLPPGVLGEARPYGGEVAIDAAMLDAPPVVLAWLVYHEWCHMAGMVDEAEADRCAVRTMTRAGLLGPASLARLVTWWAARDAARAVAIMEAGDG